MLCGNLRKAIAGAAVCLTLLLITSPSTLAAEPHEDPETAEQVFSGISLLKYYIASLDYVLQKAPTEVEARLEKMPFANIPLSLEESANALATSTISVSYLVRAMDEDLNKLRALVNQSRLEEAIALTTESLTRLSQAYSELDRIEKGVETTGEELEVFSAPVQSDLRLSYEALLERIDRVRQMLDRHSELLLDVLPGSEDIEELLESGDISLLDSLKPTDINLDIEPRVAFVGDTVRFEGVLTSEGESLAGREVDILVNSSVYVTVRTDADGNYEGILQVPYWYISGLDLQALYYPRDTEDAGLYLASLSPVVKLKLLFYEAGLDIGVEDRAYPGLETTITGMFDYGQSPPLSEREVEIYIDDVFITEVVAQETFVQKIRIAPELDVGQHVITVFAVATGRYSSVVASTRLNVTTATPFLDLSVPGVVMIPGSVGLGGRLYSEVGPLGGAVIKMEMGKSQVELVSSEDGGFDTEIKVGMALGLIGSQDLAIQVLPQEPWHSPIVTTRSVLMLNIINCGGILAIFIFLGIYLPGRLRKRLGAYAWSRARPEAAIALPESVPVYNADVIAPAFKEQSGEIPGEPRDRILYWYHFSIRLIQRMTKILLKPQQTLREFAGETSRVLGPLGRYFSELTRMVERLLYSRYRPTEEDAKKSQQLSQNVEEGLKGESV